MEVIKNWVNICVKQGEHVLLLNRQHDNFSGWIRQVERSRNPNHSLKRRLGN